MYGDLFVLLQWRESESACENTLSGARELIEAEELLQAGIIVGSLHQFLGFILQPPNLHTFMQTRPEAPELRASKPPACRHR